MQKTKLKNFEKRVEGLLPKLKLKRNTIVMDWSGNKYYFRFGNGYYFGGIHWSPIKGKEHQYQPDTVKVSGEEQDELRKIIAEKRFLERCISDSELRRAFDRCGENLQMAYDTFSRGSPICQKLEILKDHSMDYLGVDKEQKKSLVKFYRSKLHKDPNYAPIAEIEKDCYALGTLVNSRKKSEKKTVRDTLMVAMQELKKEYASDEMKEILPEQEKRLAVRATVRKKLKESQLREY